MAPYCAPAALSLRTKNSDRHVRRSVTSVLIFGLLGAIVNVALAWTCAAYGRLPLGQRSWDTDALLYCVYWRTATAERFYVRRDSRVLALPKEVRPPTAVAFPSWARAFLEPPFETEMDHRLVEARGWPLLAFCGGVRVFVAEDAIEKSYAIPLVQLNSKTLSVNSRFFPCHPLWTGLVANSLLYAAMLWILWLGIGILIDFRRMLRVHRGICPVCSYPIGNQPMCSECGMRLPVRREVLLHKPKARDPWWWRTSHKRTR